MNKVQRPVERRRLKRAEMGAFSLRRRYGLIYIVIYSSYNWYYSGHKLATCVENYVGVGLLDYMVKETVDNETGETYPAYCAINNEDYSSKMYRGEEKLYIIKANTTLDSKIHGNCYSTIFSGKVQFLAREQEVKNKLLSTKKGQKMSIEKRAARMIPHELTTTLFGEMANFRLKPTGNNTDIKLEKINTKMLSDKFSSSNKK